MAIEEIPSFDQYRSAEGADQRRARLKKAFEKLKLAEANTLGKNSSSQQDNFASEEERQRDAIRRNYAEALYRACSSETDQELVFERFLKYADTKEKELWQLFHQMDKNNDRKINVEELRAALERQSIHMTAQALQDFFNALDADADGVITFSEWSNFLLFLPKPAVDLSEVVRFYRTAKPLRSPTHAVTLDGDASLPVESRDASDPDEKPLEKGIFDGATKYLVSGGIAGAISRTATAPFDRLKVYLISSTTVSSAATKEAKKLNPTAIARVGKQGVMALLEACKNIYRENNSIKGFFVGNGLNMVKIFPESAIKFVTFESSKRWFAQNVDHVSDTTQISNSSRFIAGGLGGISSQFSIYFIETVKTRIQTSQTGQLKGNQLLAHTVKSMWAEGGIKPFYRGIGMALIGVFPYASLDAGLYEGQKILYVQRTGREEPGALASLSFGAFSGGVSCTAVYPLNLVRTRLQMQGTSAHQATYTGWRDCVQQTLRKEGVKGFYKGLAPTLLKVIPSMSLSWLVYDFSNDWLFNPSKNKSKDTAA